MTNYQMADTVMYWVIRNRKNEARRIKRDRIQGIRDTYARMGYLYECDKRVPVKIGH
jgi:hypothetical protein